MKRILVLLLLFCAIGFSQTVVRTMPLHHTAFQVYNDTLKNTQDTTNAISADNWKGVFTMFFYRDTTAAQTPAYLKIKPQLYLGTVMVGDTPTEINQWFEYYEGAFVDSIAGTYTAESYIWMNWGSYTQNGWADSVRWVISAGDTEVVKIWVGGQ